MDRSSIDPETPTSPDQNFRGAIEQSDYARSLKERGGKITHWKHLSRTDKTVVWAARIALANGRTERILIRSNQQGQKPADLGQEFRNQAKAASIGLAPEALEFCAETGLMISRFVPGKELKPRSMQEPTIAHSAVMAMRSLHCAPFEFDQKHKWLERMPRREQYLDTADLPVSVPGRYRDTAEEVRQLLLKTLPPLTPCHSDLVTQNLIWSKSNRITMIDWELSGMGDPHEELATLIWSASMTRDQIRTAISSYFGSETGIGAARTYAMLMLVPFDWCLRHAKKLSAPDITEEKANHSTTKFALRLKELETELEADSFNQALEILRDA